MSGRPGQHLILGGDFNVSLYGLTDCHHVGESIPRPRTLLDTNELDTNDSLRARALHTFVAELDLTVTNTWMDADSEEELFTRSIWSDPAESLTQMDFIMTSRKLEMRSVQVLDWFKTNHRAVLAVLSLETKMRYTVKSGANLRGWKPDDSWQRVSAETLTDWGNWSVCGGAFVVRNDKDAQKIGNQRDVCDRARAQIAAAEEEKGWTTTQEENWQSRAIWRKRRTLTGEKHLNKIKESAETDKAPKKTQSKHFNWSSIAKQENPETVLAIFFQDLYSIPVEQEEVTQSERLHRMELWKNLRVDCAGGMLISFEQTEKRERFTGSDHSGCSESISPECLEKLARLLLMMRWDMTFPEDWLCSFGCDGSESGGCNVLDQVQTDCWTLCDAESSGLRVAQVTPSTAARERANGVCAEDTRRCWPVLVVASCRLVERMAERNCGGTNGREEGRSIMYIIGLRLTQN